MASLALHILIVQSVSRDVPDSSIWVILFEAVSPHPRETKKRNMYNVYRPVKWPLNYFHSESEREAIDLLQIDNYAIGHWNLAKIQLVSIS